MRYRLSALAGILLLILFVILAATGLMARQRTAGAAARTAEVLGWSVVSLPLDVTGVTTADGAARYIMSGDPDAPGDGSVATIGRWHNGQWELRDVAGGTGPNFQVTTGDVLLVGATSSAEATFTWLGDVPTAGSIRHTLPQGGWHVVMVPLDSDVDGNGDGTATADELATHIGGVQKVARWVSGQWEIRDVGVAFAGGPNFEVRPGYPYLIMTTASTPSQWP